MHAERVERIAAHCYTFTQAIMERVLREIRRGAAVIFCMQNEGGALGR
jgi:hypothetical protein